uniref:Predicted protein n=1 Tax=Hordeum vulgare subsp. vulgare TaxID=112509 RepID=F2EH04_HORVV|nr:predicted protein [Hordeum vulgare subsp. vulgare]
MEGERRVDRSNLTRGPGGPSVNDRRRASSS